MGQPEDYQAEKQAAGVSGSGSSDELDELDLDRPWIEDDDPKDVSTANRSTTITAPGDKGPVALVETAFLASAASLMWLINLYFPPGPLLRILFPVPIALVYLRWNYRSAWMATVVSGLLLGILIGPPRSLLYVIPYGVLGVQLGYHWRRQASWLLSLPIGALIVTLGIFFRIWLLSWMAGEDLWGYLVAQVVQLTDWVTNRLLDFGLLSLGGISQPSPGIIQIAAVAMVFMSSVVYLFTVHLTAWILLERMGIPMPPPPQWVQQILDE
ncbi:DUF2232 domain-containing protein [Leptothoe kymatousa]|uniref:DUF2232 domain-containing protein n=1 Tax=Leptothoe kymatousa TAU-MAC 1615 TaxID=2364775 RepID=A0ABS5Y5E9_9CYAN|nr:DUF2232 domain-containing protein [Leptothoe kymatousa]MBT9313065.1 DUF2232 domain-containing protein [Leptothoe kymatousa TAU-MAC 1615]